LAPISLVYVSISSKPQTGNLLGMKNVTYGTLICIWKLIFVTLGF